MAHLRVEVDGEVRYDGQVGDHLIPDRPEMFPRALGAPGQTSTPPMQLPPLGRLVVLTQFIGMFCKLIEHPMIRGTAELTTHGPGKATIKVDVPGLGSIEDMRA